MCVCVCVYTHNVAQRQCVHTHKYRHTHAHNVSDSCAGEVGGGGEGYTKAAKEPLSYVGINSVGLRRRGFTSEKIREIQDIYRILYQKNYNTSQAMAIIDGEMEATPERDEILDFIRNSSRGIMKGYSGSY